MKRVACFNWTIFYESMYIISAMILFISFTMIAIFLLVSHNNSVLPLPSYKITVFFAIFTFSCGFGHLLDDVMAFYYPAYKIISWWKAWTAIIAFVTALIFPKEISMFWIKEERISSRLSSLDLQEHLKNKLE